MTQVSKYLLSDKVKQEINSIFLETISLLYKKEDIVSFLEDFLSPTERIVLSKRITIALMLKKGYSFVMIKKLIKVSQSTIAGVNLKLKYTGKGYNKVLDKMIADKKINHIFNQIEKFVLSALTIKRSITFLIKSKNLFLSALTIGKGKGTGVWFDLKVKKQQETSSII